VAEAWLNLAERASRLAMNHARRIAEHPLVRKTYGRFSGAEVRIVLFADRLHSPLWKPSG
jgi:hypothetical protein